MASTKNIILGKGIYSIPEAARYSRLRISTVRRWVFGYKDYEGIIDADLPKTDDSKAVSFLTLIELCLMSRFQEKSLHARKFRELAEKLVLDRGIVHPFAYQYLRTDGKEFFVEEAGEYRQVTGKSADNMVWRKVIEPFFKQIEFVQDYAHRWYPTTGNRLVVLNPDIRFGEPVIAGTRIATSNVIEQLEAGDSRTEVAKCYGISIAQVNAAKRFEERFPLAA